MSETIAGNILVWNRRERREEVEKVYGDAWVRWLYGSTVGQKAADWFLSGRLVSQAYGLYQGSRFSGHKVEPFIEAFQIPMDEYEGAPFRSFNDFFIRKFKPQSRTFVAEPGLMPAFSEARYYAFDQIREDQVFPVKGTWLSPEMLLGSAERANPFVGGSLLLARLCPTDYHRFHFPDDGELLESYRLHGRLHSVNPMALKYKGQILATNERQVSILTTKNFGRLAYIEVGALCVGKIVQTCVSPQFKRGQEKGYFLFGGSTVIVLGEPGRWKPDADLIEQTARERETLIKLGDRIATAL